MEKWKDFLEPGKAHQKIMKGKGNPSIVYLTSSGSLDPFPGFPTYAFMNIQKMQKMEKEFLKIS